MNKKTSFGQFAECNGHCTRQNWKRGDNPFPSFAECHDHGTRQRIVLKKIKKNFAECHPSGTRQRIF